ncbi:MAG: ACP S-malonyltransferase [Treponema sp.]|jgi:[acyl-carrier-protein] S-malonyltransferase|nr:ACP S-malonyltransferase [Treponema sp.]
MVKYIFAFPGQGAQTPGMIKDICEKHQEIKAVLDRFSQVTGIDVPSLLWNSTEEELARSDNSQIAITASSLVAVEILKKFDIKPDVLAGFSLGEWSALCVSGVLSFEETAYAVKKRGEIMQSVCDEIAEQSHGNVPGMAACIGLEPETIIKAIEGIKDVFAANLNSFKQTVLSGTKAGLERATEVLKEAGAKRVIPLKVAGPFHSPLMQKAAEQFEKVLDELHFNNPGIPLFSNVTGKQITNAEEAKINAIKHLTHPVLWTDEEREIAEFCKKNTSDEFKFIEAGPGKVLNGLWSDSGNAEVIPSFQWEELIAQLEGQNS